MASKLTVTTKSQSAGSATLSYTSAAQSYVSGKVTSTGSADVAGGHSHGFGHTHAISAHTHSIDAHTHKYDKATVGSSAAAITVLSTKSYTPHTHTDTTVVNSTTNATAITYVYGGTTTSVVRDMISSAKSFTTSSAAPGTNSVHTMISGEITFPGLTFTSGSVSVSSSSITPAAAGTEKAIKSITFTSSSFVTGLTTGTDKTSTNIGGN